VSAVPGTVVLELRAPVTGLCVPLEDVPDPAFAQRLVGDGASIDPLGDRVVAPCDAEVVSVHRAGHAVTLRAHGLELVIHVGVDTVQLQGTGFTPLVRAGTRVRAGTPLLAFDADLVGRRARSLLTQLLVTSMERVTRVEVATGRVTAGHDLLLRVHHAGAAVEEGVDAVFPVESSEPVTVQAATGLHARPAAALVAAARRFTADVRLRKGGQRANARSLVSIMALEVAHGDALVVEAQGADAADAVRSLAQLLASDLDAIAAGGTGAPPSPAPASTGMPVGPVAHEPLVAGSVLRGVAASPGVAIGTVVQLRHDDPVVDERASDAAHERRALDAAVAAAHLQLEALRARLAAEADPDKAAIFAAHQELLEDPEVLDAADARIVGGASAAFAWKLAYTAQAERLAALSSTVLAGRAADLRDVGRRVLHILVGRPDAGVQLPAGAIVVAEDLTPSDTASFDRSRVAGLCTTMGSTTSHVAILARGLGIPAVLGADARVLSIVEGTRVVLDGDAGQLQLAPDAATEANIVARRDVLARRRAADLAAASAPAVTRDGHRVEIAANVGATREATDVVAHGGEGVGLLRSEFLFMERRTPPDEEEQRVAYAAVAGVLGPERLLVIRTLDVGGDKPLAFLPMETEANPFLGERGVRVSLARPALFRTQLRAILRASTSGRVAVMFPMISTLDEWRRARALLEEERASLGVPPVPVGIMVETAAAAMLADRFAREADFLSIGTNDLTQYTLAMDRTNPRLAPQVDALAPSVLRLIERTVAGARAHGRWVGVCGALAGDASAIPVLVGLGVDELSVDIPLVPATKARVRRLAMTEARETARLALDCDDGAAVRALVAARHPEDAA
jgi:phosphocarrier protein FPr